jgi:hypothetical protein
MIGCVTIIIGDLASLLGCSMQVGTGKRWEHLSSPLDPLGTGGKQRNHPLYLHVFA